MNILVRILKYLTRYKWTVGAFYLCLFVALAMQLTIPQVIAKAIDRGIRSHDLGYLARAALIIVGLSIIQGIFHYARNYGSNSVAERVANDIRNEMYDVFQQQSFRYYDRAQTGQLMSRATEDINQIRGMLMFCLRTVVQSIVMLIAIAAIVLTTDWRLGLIALSTTPFLIIWSMRFHATIRPIFLSVQQQFGVMTSALQENVAGGRVVRAFAQETQEAERFETELNELFNRNLSAAKRFAFGFPLTLLLNGISVAGVIWVGGIMVINGSISLGTLVAFERYTSMLQDPVRWVGFVVNRLARAIAAGERIFEIIDAKVAIEDRPDARALPDMRGEVEFHDVTFRYRRHAADALEDVSFTAHPGQITALVGPTGSGKSTVTTLIPRFYDVTSGAVTIDGVDVRDITLASLRSQIGIVMQESFLFSMTVRENIAYGNPDASLDEVIAAAKAAKAHDFILRMDDGYNTVIGERGVTLSGGQKQRLSIARALLINPRILILDDATASVDSETEHDIQQALRVLMAGRTSFVIAQRLTTVRDADQILVFEEGRITQAGTHDELLAQEQGFYAELYGLQMQDQEEAMRDFEPAEDPDAIPEQSGAPVAVSGKGD